MNDEYTRLAEFTARMVDRAMNADTHLKLAVEQIETAIRDHGDLVPLFLAAGHVERAREMLRAAEGRDAQPPRDGAAPKRTPVSRVYSKG